MQDKDECPQGGRHEWTEDEDWRFCGKCKEPGDDQGGA
jgi:hypothetical protein